MTKEFKLNDIQRKKNKKKMKIVSGRVKPENKIWFHENKIDLDKLIDKLKEIKLK